MYGKKFWGVQRATFIIDAEGTIGYVIPKASPKTHDVIELVAAGLPNAEIAAVLGISPATVKRHLELF